MDKRILCIGQVVLDCVVIADEYPEEDTLVGGQEHLWQRGGNAANNCGVLIQLNCQAELLSSFPKNSNNDRDDSYTKFLVNDLKKDGVHLENCPFHEKRECPYSVIIINAKNGSRTIVHQFKNLPEVTLNDFQKLNLDNYKWIHFEGRCPEKYSPILQEIQKWNASQHPENRIPVSLEMEFLDIDHDTLTPYADYVFVNKLTPKKCGFLTKEEAVRNYMLPIKAGAIVIFPWGDEGAVARASDGEVVTALPFHPPRVVDTLGAGDTFVAGTIYALCEGHNLSSSISFACKLAGTKCGMQGFQGLKDIAMKIYKNTFDV